MKITFYKMTSDEMMIDKKRKEVKTYDKFYLKEDSNVLNPTIIIDGIDELFDSDISKTTYSLQDVNYAYIYKFKRYYYITNTRFLDRNRVEFSLKVDVLNTYKDEILNSKQHVIRNENNFNLYLDDSEITTETDTHINILVPTGGAQLSVNPDGHNFILNSL